MYVFQINTQVVLKADIRSLEKTLTWQARLRHNGGDPVTRLGKESNSSLAPGNLYRSCSRG